uniref:Uncharacterized protein n=1 Tax=Octopus bimaculoides TaxID=37653 RepID=A0A0L8HL50_OCTBM
MGPLPSSKSNFAYKIISVPTLTNVDICLTNDMQVKKYEVHGWLVAGILMKLEYFCYKLSWKYQRG